MQNQNHGQKMAYYEGADGKLYYNFAQGLKVVLREGKGETAEEYTLEIVGCHFSSGTEYYDIARDGVTQPYAQSANRVKFLLSRYSIKTLADGERLELPLILEEVQRYYSHRYHVYLKTSKQAEAIPEYKALTYELRGFGYKIGTALAYERTEEAASLQKKQFEIQRRIEAVLKSNGINPADLQEQKCDKCDGKGFDYFGICDCALAQSAKIKAFCAAERRQLKKLTGGNGGN